MGTDNRIFGSMTLEITLKIMTEKNKLYEKLLIFSFILAIRCYYSIKKNLFASFPFIKTQSKGHNKLERRFFFFGLQMRSQLNYLEIK